MSDQEIFKVEYGVESFYVDVTNIALCENVTNGVLKLPALDIERYLLFGDPLPYIVKNIRVTQNGNFRVYPDGELINIDVSDLPLKMFLREKNNRLWFDREGTPEQKLESIHRNIRLKGGSMKEEYPEQLLVATFLGPKAKVLELGSNIGRNAHTIATILEDQKNLVTLESDAKVCDILRKNMHDNGYDFNIENCALSYRKLIQRGCDSTPGDVVKSGFFEVKTITFQELEEKYNIKFDTLVVDCEGALYYILLDYPDILDNINMVIMENDYRDQSHKDSVDSTMNAKGFSCIHTVSGGWGPCYKNFYEVWSK